MAILIPNRLTKDLRATPGESRVFDAFGKHLSKHWYIWFDLGLGNTEIYPDFTLVHPQHGLLVLEVKDTRFDGLVELNKDRFRTRSGSIRNPIIQARQYVLTVVNRVRNDSTPFGYGVVFPYITRKELEQPVNGVLLTDLIDPKLIITKDELNDGNIEQRLVAMFPSAAKHKQMSMSEFDALRSIIDPSIVVPNRYQTLASGEQAPATLSLVQERAAKSVGEGHRLMHGIAGSGKTLVMLYRAKLIARMNPSWKVLFLCWNRALITYLEQVYESISMEGQGGNVEFRSYNSWLTKLSFAHGLGHFTSSSGNAHDGALMRTQELLDRQPTMRYDAILIDEGQDFHEDFYRLIVQHLNPETNSLLICYDHAQNLYRRTVSWKKLGVQVQGKRPIRFDVAGDSLEKNYRNTREVIRFAMLLYNDAVPTKNADDTESTITELGATGETGPMPEFRMALERKEEIGMVLDWIEECLKAGVPLHDIMILYPKRYAPTFNLERDLLPALKRRGIPYVWLAQDSSTKKEFDLSEPAVKVSTIYSGKGMDYESVAAIACDLIEDDEPEALLYVSATRARRHLLMSMGGVNPAIERVLSYAYEHSRDWDTVS